jgi:hypothetical protein
MNRQQILKQLDDEILQAVRNGSHLTYREIGTPFGVSECYVGILARKFGIKRSPGRGSPAWKFKHAESKKQGL